MKTHISFLKVATALLGLMAVSDPAESAEVVLDFEDAVTTNYYDTIPIGYGGLTWDSNIHIINVNAISGTGYQYGTIGSYSIFNGGSSSISIAFPSAVDFDGAYFTNAWTASSTITVQGYLNGVALYSTTISPNSTTSPTWFSLAFEGVDELLLIPSLSSQGHFVVDDFTYHTDDDNDGYTSYTDCDDSDASINPGATEYCDGVDNDCDGSTDEDTAVDAITWYADADSDGYGDASTTDVECYQPTGYVADNTDCNDSNNTTYPTAPEYCDGVDNNCSGTTDEDTAVDVLTWYADADADGYGDASTTDVECYQPTGYVADNTDCNDSNNTTYPTAPEYCDGVDNDCDGTTDEDSAVDALTWYADADSDGYGDASTTDVECYQPTAYVADNTDCDDSNNTTYPTAPEYCDVVDNNCDGTTDEDTAVDASTWYADADSDGYGDASTTDIECYQPTAYVADNTDCDDSNNTTYPGAPEYCDGVDNDCDGTVDEDTAVDALTWYGDSDSDGYGDAAVMDIECYQPTGYVLDNTDCDDAEATTYPGADEYCDGHDDNCDGDTDEDASVDVSTWYADADSDGYGDAAVTDMDCYLPTGYVADDTDCDDTDADTYPGAEEWCDGHDDNCDGITDEDDSMDSITWYIDADGDGEGDSSISGDSCYGATGYVENSTDCDDNDPTFNTSDSDGDGFTSCDSDCNDGDATINIDATEVWYDGVDQNCDAWSDYDQDADGFDHLDYNGDDCNDEDADINVDAAEIWYDGTDQDCDALSDYDADYDGQESETYGGEDCNDADPDTYTGAPDTPYDGIINDCDNANDNDADGDGAISADYGGKDCDDANSDINPSAEEIWYDGVDQDCDGNDDDQDGDGYALDADCDDENADLAEDCTADTGGDTGGSDTGAGYDTLDKDSGGCFSSTTGGKPTGVWALLLAGALLLRRKSQRG
jgi:MYXO-CTERM domain-containing protein